MATKKNDKKLNSLTIETAQDVVPIIACHDKENLLQSYEGQYSRMYKISEINYQTLSQEEQEHLFEKYRALINSMNNNTEFSITLHNRSIDMQNFEDSVLAKERGDNLDSLREEMNKITLNRVKEGKNGIRTDKYFTVSSHARNLHEASVMFHRIDRDLDTSFQKIGSSAKPVLIEDRIDELYNYYNPGHTGELLTRTKEIDEQTGITVSRPAFSFENMRQMGLTIKDILAPSSITFRQNYIEIGDKFAVCMSVNTYPSILSDEFFLDLCNSNYNMIANFNINPLTNSEADRLVNMNLTMIRAEKSKAQQQALRDGADIDMINPTLLEREDEAMDMRDAMRENDERLFETSLTILVYGNTLEEASEYAEAIISEGRRNSVIIKKMVGLQDIGFISTLPLCLDLNKAKRTFKSSSVSTMIPFSVIELNDPDGINYSMNAISKNLILYDRKSQFNANGFILGTSGAGKSFAAKTEMINVLLKTDDDIIVIDPEAEYAPLCTAVGGEMIKIVPGGKDSVNPMTIYVDETEDADPVLEKVDFILSLCNLIVKTAWGIDSVQETIIDECVHKLYEPFMTNEGDKKYMRQLTNEEMPTLTDLYKLVVKRPEPEAREVAYALQLYTGNGSLAVFGGKQTVDFNNSRFIVIDTNSLGKKFMPVAMQVLLDAIWQKIVENRKRGRHTWFYVDEIYLLFKNDVSAEWLQQLWKRARKYGGVPTGITQNVEDLLNSETARSMLANSSFVEMLNQSPTDREKLKNLFNLSSSQTDYITDAPRGQGLLYTGSQTIPFYSQFPKESTVYRYLTSDLVEIQKFKEEQFKKNYFND